MHVFFVRLGLCAFPQQLIADCIWPDDSQYSPQTSVYYLPSSKCRVLFCFMSRKTRWENHPKRRKNNTFDDVTVIPAHAIYAVSLSFH